MTGHKLTHIFIQLLRRFSQLLTIAALAALSFLSLYAHYFSAKATEDFPLMVGLKGNVLIYIDTLVSPLKDPLLFLDGFKGTLWSMRFAGIELSDPLAAVELIATTKSFYLPFMISIIIPVVGTLVLGRIFCSWICPAQLLFEMTHKFRAVLKFAEIPPGNISFSLNNKYLVLAVGLIAAVIVAQPLFALFYPPAVLSRLMHAWIFGTALTGLLIIMLLLVTVELFVSPRWWCRTMCPGGALYALIGWPRLLRVKLNHSRCTLCGKCEPVCDPGINPVSDSYGLECTNCGDCVKECPERALHFSLGLPALGKEKHTKKKIPSQAAIPLAIFFMLLTVFPTDSYAHHILGLPHYSYKENYPQTPTLEYPAMSGPYDILLTSYPGKPVPGEAASFSFYVKNRETGDPYNLPITIRVLQTFTFGESKVILKPTVSEPFQHPHKLSLTFPEDGEYVVELTMEVEGKPETIPFILTAGEPSATTSVLIAVGIFLLLFIITVRAIKIKRTRRLEHASL
jgi:ferredoxin-type protein NapH